MPWWLIALGAYLVLKKGSALPGASAGALPAAGSTVPVEVYNRLQAQMAALQRKCAAVVTGPVTERVVDTTAVKAGGTVAGFDMAAGPRRPRTRPAKGINFPATPQDIVDEPDDDLDDDEREDLQ